MPEGPSILSLAAAGLYAIVALSCITASVTAKQARHPGWHWSSWAILGFFFVLLLVGRVTGLEDALRDSAREVLRAGGTYEERRGSQSVIVASVVGIGGILAMGVFYRAAKGSRGRRDVSVKIAIAAGTVMAGLVVLRLISLHAVDQALYGPLKLNWVGDIGASCLVLGCAAYFVWLVRSTRGARRR